MSGRILVTGCNGFLGAHLMEGARARGIDAVGLHRGAHSDGPGERVSIDLLDGAQEARLADVLGTVDSVIHAAAAVRLFGPHRSVVAENTASTARLLDVAAASGAPRVVFLSSASVLFRPRDQLLMGEDTPLPRRFLSGYSASKARCEELVAGYPGPSVILRPQGVLGPGDRVILPPLLEAARAGRMVWVGAPGAVQADLLSVDNLVEWTLRASQERGAEGLLHLSDGEPQEVEGIVRTVLARLGFEPVERRIPRPVALAFASAIELPLRLVAPGREPPLTRFAVETFARTRTLDITRVRDRLGAPLVSFDEGLERMVAFHVSAGGSPQRD